jgi:hypothetical protein
VTYTRGALISLAVLFSVATASAQESNSPYIDEIKKGLKDKPTSEDASESFIEREQKKLKTPESQEGYIEELKRKNPSLKPKEDEGSFTEQEKPKVGEDRESAIQAFKEGRSELKPRRTGEITGAFGFRVGAGVSRTMTNAAGMSYADVYGSDWAPDLTGFYEWQPFHSEIFGNFGLVVSGGLAYFRNLGRLAFNLTNPIDGSQFGFQARTYFTLLVLPASIGLNYRFNLAKYVRPYVQAAPTAIGYLESRSDGKAGHRGFSTGLALGGGLNILMDFIQPGSAWELYEEHAIKHYYLTVDYTRLSTISGDVRFSINAVSLGMTFEI